ncbi:MAG: hypothetical protein IJO28_06215, partial [Oscillospiraceae bacterium]|nr:hypothetical protein [Oscillospiraceae bacterium]
EFPTINLLMLFPNSSNPSDLAVLGHLPYRGGVGVLSFIVVCKHVKIAGSSSHWRGNPFLKKSSFFTYLLQKNILLGTDSHVASLLGMTRIFEKDTF